MTEAHTPGPWKLEDRDDGAEGYILRGANDDMIEYIERSRYFHNIADPEQEANARLIAAAPEMLEALEDLCSFDTPLTQDKWDNARDAIAKARGEA